LEQNSATRYTPKKTNKLYILTILILLVILYKSINAGIINKRYPIITIIKLLILTLKIRTKIPIIYDNIKGFFK
ncbi:hypothetical protein ACLJ4O_001608, partial [Campylobacter jejuni]